VRNIYDSEQFELCTRQSNQTFGTLVSIKMSVDNIAHKTHYENVNSFCNTGGTLYSIYTIIWCKL